MRIVLASASPRRRELLGQIGLAFEVVVSNVEESTTARDPAYMVEELSAQKAEAVLRMLEAGGARASAEACGSAGDAERPEGMYDSADGACGAEELLVVGADTVVAVDGRILGKPADAQEAARMLGLLSGRSHEVYTGVTLLHRSASGELSRKVFHERTVVTFYPMSEAEIAEYVSTGDGLDKAGAYGVQGICARYVKGVEGDYNNVVGLPVGRLYQEVKREEGCDF